MFEQTSVELGWLPDILVVDAIFARQGSGNDFEALLTETNRKCAQELRLPISFEEKSLYEELPQGYTHFTSTLQASQDTTKQH